MRLFLLKTRNVFEAKTAVIRCKNSFSFRGSVTGWFGESKVYFRTQFGMWTLRSRLELAFEFPATGVADSVSLAEPGELPWSQRF